MIKILYLFFILLFSPGIFANTITVFAAASLNDVLEKINTLYRKTNPKENVRFSFASSSTLARQIADGAPADIFFSADQEWMNYVTKKRPIAQHPETLLGNTLVLIAPKDSETGPQNLSLSIPWKLLLPGNTRIAIGDPQHVPAGKYAKDSLTNLGVYNTLKAHMAYANDVRSALRFVELGEAKLGIVYATDAMISQKIKILGYFPADKLKPIEYPAVLLNNTAKSFYDFLKTAKAQTVFKKYGFIVL